MRLLEVLEVFGMVWKVLEGLQAFGGFCGAMGSFDMRGEALGGFGRFYRLWTALSMLWEASALEGFGKLLKKHGGLW